MKTFTEDLKNFTHSITIHISFLFVAIKKIMKSDVYYINTRQKFNFHQPLSNLSLYQKGVYSFRKKVFNNPPRSMKSLIDKIKQFQSMLRNHLHTNYFYT
jgi:hypothetical protein